MVATPNLFLNPFSFFGSLSRRDSGFDTNKNIFLLSIKDIDIGFLGFDSVTRTIIILGK